jgi:hypothetical protein
MLSSTYVTEELMALLHYVRDVLGSSFRPRPDILRDFFTILLSPRMKMPRQNLKIGDYPFLHHMFTSLLIVLSFDVIQPEMLTASLNKPHCIVERLPTLEVNNPMPHIRVINIIVLFRTLYVVKLTGLEE